jgi:hypothetical protein
VLVLSACGGPHLGDGYGRRNHAAFEAQAQGRGEANRAVDGEDAKAILQRHRGLTKDSTQQPQRPGAIIVPTLTSSGSSSSSSSNYGSTREMGGIRLDAVR